MLLNMISGKGSTLLWNTWREASGGDEEKETP
jgi:hypothetical protein